MNKRPLPTSETPDEMEGPLKKSLQKLTLLQKEELLIGKLSECIVLRGQLNQLRDEMSESKKCHQMVRSRCKDLEFQVKRFNDIVNRYKYELNTPGFKNCHPVVACRSVGIQVTSPIVYVSQ